MKNKITIFRIPKRVIAPAVILLVCLVNGLGFAQNPNPNPNPNPETKSDGWAQARVDSIAVLLAERQNESAVALARSLVDELEHQNAQGADLALGLEALARSLRRNREYRKPATLEIARRAVAACSDLPTAGPNLKAACLNTLGLIFMQTAEFDEALPLFQDAGKLWTEARGFEDQKVAAAYNNQGLVLGSLGRNDEARLVLEKAANIYEARRDEPKYLIKFAQTTMGIAKLHIKLGQYDEASLRGEQAVEIYRSAEEGNHPKLGPAMGDLAALYRTIGDWDRSESLYENSIPLIKKAYGPDASELGRVLNNLGNLRADRGDIAAARSCFENALAITEKIHGPDDPQTGVRLLNLGSIMADLGDVDLAAGYLLRSESIFLDRLGPDHLYNGYVKQDLGTVLISKGNLDDGLTRLLEAQKIIEGQLGLSHLAVAGVLRDVGEVLMEMGRYSEADTALTRGLAIVREELGPEHPDVVDLLHSQGRLALKKDDLAVADFILSQALHLGEAALGSDHPNLAGVHFDLAMAKSNLTKSDLGQLTAAFDHALMAERIGRNHFALAAAAFEERRVLQYAQKRTNGLGLAMTLAVKISQTDEAPTVPARLWEELVRSRSVVLDLMGTRQRFHQSAPGSQALVDSLGKATDELAHLYVRGVGEDSPDDHLSALTSARARRENLERQLAASSLDFARQIAMSKAGFKDVARDLDPDAGLVSFLTGSGVQGTDPSTVALVLKPGATSPELHFLGSTQKIENAVSRWRQTIVDGLQAEGEQLPSITANCLAAGRDLAALIWDPLNLDQVQGPLYIVPDGAISFVDFATLPRAEGGFLVENEALLVLVSSERDLLNRTRPVERDTGLLVMGGMDFGSLAEANIPNDESPLEDSYKNLRFQELPGTAHEANTVADMWSEFSGLPVQKMLGEDAAEGVFKKSISQCEVVHLATHGFFLDQRSEAPGDLVNPLLRAGLAFSGANKKASQDDAEDGILTAYEVASLDMSGVEVVVLSACNTGQGEMLNGEGVFGLQRAFALAGARNMILSLWPVDDGVAATWMGHLYRNHLVEGMDYSLAARQASRVMLQEQRAQGWPEHPFTWSPFVKIRTGS